MKSIGLILSYLSGASRRGNMRLVGALVSVFLVLIALFTVIFHVLMAREGRQHSWATGIYWTFTVMSTLGFGDVTFESDAGRLFSVVVLISGALFILVLLPFVFIQFVFMPWVAWRDANRAPRKVADDVSGHIVLVGTDPVAEAVIRRAVHAGVPYVVIESDPTTALARFDEGTTVMIGDPDHPDTYRAARVEHAALVTASMADTTNTNIAFTVREISADVPIVATARNPESADILTLAGCNEVLKLGEILGRAMAERVLGRDARSQMIGRFGNLRIAEATASHPDLVGRTLRESQIGARVGVNVVGTWQRGIYQPADPAMIVEDGAALILAGTDAQLTAYDDAFSLGKHQASPVVVIGAGRVGRAAGKMLGEAGFPWKVVEKLEGRIRDPEHYVLGDAADIEVLQEAGIDDAIAAVITTHDDDVNVYLTIYCRRLRPDLQIISRANLERNVATLHRAGADGVLSAASLGASLVWNAMGVDDTLVVTEGLEVFRCPVPSSIAGLTIGQSNVRETTGCTVLAVSVGDDSTVNPSVDHKLPIGGEIVVIADPEAQERFAHRFPSDTSKAERKRWRRTTSHIGPGPWSS
ncbi:MAG: NAD-binding protein [Aquihabitans sp.]